MSIRIPSFAALLVLASMPLTSHAEAQRREGHGPPPEALAACEGRSAGASCSVTTPHGTMSGTCGAPEGRALACMPARPPGDERGHRGPPPEALDACVDHAIESACSVTTPDGTMNGFCHGPEGRALACVPAGHGMTPEHLETCAGIEAGDACVIDGPGGVVEGRCIAGPEGTACVPPRPSHRASRDA